MKIEINGSWVDVVATTLEAALAEQGFTDKAVATAVNGDFVPLAARATLTLRDGDRVEVLAPMQGG